MLRLILIKLSVVFLLASFLEAGELSKRTGKIIEHIQSGGYSYLQLKEKKDIIWVAVPKTDLKKGEVITVTEQMWMKNFESKTLNKTFDKILFATYKNNRYSQNDVRKAEDIQFPSLASVLKIPKEEKVVLTDALKINSVKELKSKKSELKDKTIQLNGKVTKILRGIMKTSWVHVSDKNGDSIIFRAKKEELAVGDNIVATGILHTDVDYGYGYTYETIVTSSNFKKN